MRPMRQLQHRAVGAIERAPMLPARESGGALRVEEGVRGLDGVEVVEAADRGAVVGLGR